MEKNIILSFCIPSYNKKDRTVDLVRDILKYEKRDIEVIVVDNCSTDNTIIELNKIKDSRLHVFENEKNIGAIGNWIKSLKLGTGLYSFVALSRDGIYPNKIEELISYIKDNNYSALYCGEDIKDRPNRAYKQGEEALMNFAFKTFHPTGHIYKTDLIKTYLSSINIDYAKDLYCTFPHDFWNALACLDGDVCLYNKVIRCRVPDEYYNNNKSTFQQKGEKLWFYPEGICNQTIASLSFTKTLPINPKIKKKLFASIYKHQYKFMTEYYNDWVADYNFCNHYGIEPKKVTLLETIKNVICLNKSVMSNNSLYMDLFIRLFIFFAPIKAVIEFLHRSILKLIKRLKHKLCGTITR